jgi:competence protein ComEA
MKRLISCIVALTFSMILSNGLAFAADTKAAPAKPPIISEKKAAPDTKDELLDINSATEDQLKALPGIGEADSKKIIAGRPYAKRDQLKSKKIVTPAIFEKINDLIIAKQPKN